MFRLDLDGYAEPPRTRVEPDPGQAAISTLIERKHMFATRSAWRCPHACCRLLATRNGAQRARPMGCAPLAVGVRSQYRPQTQSAMARELEPWSGDVRLPRWLRWLLRRPPEAGDTHERRPARQPDKSVAEAADRAAVGPLSEFYREGARNAASDAAVRLHANRARAMFAGTAPPAASPTSPPTVLRHLPTDRRS
jgi:hypothetical protein